MGPQSESAARQKIKYGLIICSEYLAAAAEHNHSGSADTTFPEMNGPPLAPLRTVGITIDAAWLFHRGATTGKNR